LEFCKAHETSGSVDRIEHSAALALLFRCVTSPNRYGVLVLIRALVTSHPTVAASSSTLPSDHFLHFRFIDFSLKLDHELLNFAQAIRALLCCLLRQDSDDFERLEPIHAADEALSWPNQVG